MIKRTLYFSNPCRLSKKDDQLRVEYPEREEIKSVPVEDIGLIVLDNPRITFTHALLMSLTENNAAILSCNWQHLPEALMLPMTGHHAFTEKARCQLDASVPLMKNLWQQSITAKILNQASLLDEIGVDTENMHYWAGKVRSGDPDNLEGRAAAYYWKNVFMHMEEFRRNRYGEPPNNLLNYGYAVLRAVVARSLVASGMITFYGIHHKNKYNVHCLADDIMEPYRPFVDWVVLDIISEISDISELNPDVKKRLLVIPAMDVMIEAQKSPLMIAAQRTTAALMKCFEGESRKMVYPELLVA